MLTALLLAPLVASSAANLKFDLTCNGSEKTIHSGTSVEDRPWSGVLAIDLQNRQANVGGASNKDIISATPSMIVLNGADGSEEFINRDLGVYSRTIKIGGMHMYLTATCEKTKFTGLVKPKF